MPDELNGAAPAVTESTSAPTILPETPTVSVESSEPAARSFSEIAEAVWNKHNPPREQGKFAPRNPSEAAPETAAPETETTDQAQTTAPEQAQEPAIGAPQSWSAEEKAHWAKVPPEAQSVIARRETEAHRQISQMGQQIKATEPVRSVLDQHRDYLQRIGRSPEDAMSAFFKASRHLDQDPQAAIRNLAQMYRVDLRALANGQPQQPTVPATDPRLEARLRRMEAEATNRSRAEQAQREQSVIETIEKFAQDKSHPHFNDLEDEILAQLPGIQKLSPHLSPEQQLDQAYEKAKWAHPNIRERILMDQRKADEDKRKAEHEKQIKEAKRQAAINQPSGKGSTPVKGTIRDSLERHANRLMPGN
jgi:hypothetical protein